MNRPITLIAALWFAAIAGAADLVPSSSLTPSRMRVVNAEHGLGVVGGIPARTSSVIDLTEAPYNFVPGGDITSALSAAINSLASSGSETAILMPAGTHTFSGLTLPVASGLIPKRDYTIRGAGMSETILTATGSLVGGLGSNFNGGEVSVTGGLTADSTAVTVSDATLVTANRFAKFVFPNDSRVPVFQNNTASDYIRTYVVYVSSVNTGTNTVTFTPPLPEDFSDLATHTGLPVVLRGEPNIRPISGVGLEGFTLDLTGSSVVSAILLNSALNCWVKDVKYIGHTGHGFLPTTTVNLEIRKLWAGASSGSGSNKSGILVSESSSLLIEDSIIEDNQPGIEFWIGNTNCVFGYNYMPRGTNRLNINVHNAHNSFIFVEGSIATNFQLDTYFGTVSKMGVFRSWLTGRHGTPVASITRSGGTATVTTGKSHTYSDGSSVAIRGAAESDYNGNYSITVTSPTTFTYAVANSPPSPATGDITSSVQTFTTDIQALSRDVFLVGNILRSPGFTNPDSGYSFGWPYGGFTAGEATPSAGDWWFDYDVANSRPKAWQGTLTERTDSTSGVVTFSEAVADDIEASLAISLERKRAASYANFTTFGTRAGNSFPISAASNPLPAETSSVTFYPSVFGFRERDLDVEITTTKRVNYNNYDNAIPLAEAQGDDPFPDSLYRSAKPDWFGTLAWPPIDPYFPPAALDESNVSVLPAAYRYYNANAEDYLGPSAPSFSVQPSSQTVTVGDNVTLTVAVSGSPTPTLQWRKGGSNISGETSASLVLTNVQLGDAGSYDCVATNSEDTATSTAAVLTVNAAPSGGGSATATTLNASTLNIQ